MISISIKPNKDAVIDETLKAIANNKVIALEYREVTDIYIYVRHIAGNIKYQTLVYRKETGELLSGTSLSKDKLEGTVKIAYEDLRMVYISDSFDTLYQSIR